MPDLHDELRRIAAQAASTARPLPAAEVIRRGNRARRRQIARSCIAAAVGAGVVTVVVLAGTDATGHSSPQPPATQPANPSPAPTRPPTPSPTPAAPSQLPSRGPVPSPSAAVAPTSQPAASPSPTRTK